MFESQFKLIETTESSLKTTETDILSKKKETEDGIRAMTEHVEKCLE